MALDGESLQSLLHIFSDAPLRQQRYNGVVSSFNPTSPTSVKRFLRERGFHPSKRLGQSFLIDQGTAGRIVSASGLMAGESCLEIGPGLGALTAALAGSAGALAAVEVDARLAELLRDEYADTPSIRIIHADFLKIDLARLLEELGGRARVVANIPYSITTPIIERLLAHKDGLSGVTLLVQKEVAERITATPGSGAYSSLSVFCAYHAEARIAFGVSRNLFWPVPEVDSSVLTLTPKKAELEDEEEQAFFQILRSAFGQRRKTVLNTLSSGLDIPKDALGAIIGKAGISPGARAEELSLEDYKRLARSPALKTPGESG